MIETQNLFQNVFNDAFQLHRLYSDELKDVYEWKEAIMIHFKEI
jgi:hypothetical protein